MRFRQVFVSEEMFYCLFVVWFVCFYNLGEILGVDEIFKVVKFLIEYMFINDSGEDELLLYVV